MKQVEEFIVSPIEQELSFSAWCRKNNIKKIIFDGDDSLWMTRPVFRQKIKKCSDFLARIGIMSSEEWTSKIDEISNKLFEAHGVNPDRWDFVVDQLTDSYHLSNTYRDKSKNILSEIYTTPLKFINGTPEGLSFLKKINDVTFGIITHANRGWTHRKYQWLNLNKYIDPDDIFIVDENGHKTKESWQEGMDYFKTKPENCLVGGDSPRADINPVCKLGVRHCFLVQNSYDIWSLHQQPVDETKTMAIKSINDLRYLGKEIIYRH
jgi:FMN phosphatase YigB (HAD superfamily)